MRLYLLLVPLMSVCNAPVSRLFGTAVAIICIDIFKVLMKNIEQTSNFSPPSGFCKMYFRVIVLSLLLPDAVSRRFLDLATFNTFTSLVINNLFSDMFLSFQKLS